MKFVEFGEPIPIPADFRCHIVVNPPTYKYINTCEHQAEPVRITTEEDVTYLFTIKGYKHIGEKDRLYSGQCSPLDENGDFTNIQGGAFLLILNEGTQAHEAEIWVESGQRNS